jgi:hypothetical protein
MNRQSNLLKIANSKGYKVTVEGVVINNCKIIPLKQSKRGYLSFNLRDGNKTPTRCYVHRLQAYQRYGDKLFGEGIVVRHLNGQSTDNSIDNIAIGTMLDNILDIPKQQRVLNSSHPKYDHSCIVEDRNKGMSYKDIMIKYNIKSKGTISFIINKSLLQTSNNFQF